jgi:hypothetical protein
MAARAPAILVCGFVVEGRVARTTRTKDHKDNKNAKLAFLGSLDRISCLNLPTEACWQRHLYESFQDSPDHGPDWPWAGVGPGPKNILW